MKLTIDTTAKTIEFNEEINIVDLVDTVKALFPSGVWKEFKLTPTASHANWYPYVPQFDPAPIQPYYFTTGPGTTGDFRGVCNDTFTGTTTDTTMGRPQDQSTYTTNTTAEKN